MRSYIKFLFAAVLVPAIGCAPAVRLDVLKPAEVFVPPHIETVAFVDRSKAATKGQKALGILEGALTGEAIGADNAGRREAARGLVETLQGSPRFNVVQGANQKTDSNLFDKELRWPVAKRICKELGCQAIVALEAFDSDSFVDMSQEKYTETVDGREVKRVRHVAVRETSVVVAWRLYDTTERIVLDDRRDYKERDSWRGTGPNPDAARADLPGQIPTIEDVAFRSGKAYGKRIAPVYITVTRNYYKGKDQRMKDAVAYIRGQNWEEALELWRAVYRSAPDDKTKGQAAFNIALYWEVRGDLPKALSKAKEAQKLFPNGKTSGYVHTLDKRRQDQARLRKQMSGAPE